MERTTVDRLAPAPAIADETPLSFDEVYRRWFHHVTRWAHALGGPASDLDDLAQEVFLVVRRQLGGFDGRSLSSWLFAITHKTVSDQRRRVWFRRLFVGRRQLPLEKLRSVSADPSEELERKQRQLQLYALLDRISDKRRAVFVLYEVEEYSGEEIARLLDVPLATVWTRLHHARKELAALAAKLEGAR